MNKQYWWPLIALTVLVGGSYAVLFAYHDFNSYLASISMHFESISIRSTPPTKPVNIHDGREHIINRLIRNGLKIMLFSAPAKEYDTLLGVPKYEIHTKIKKKAATSLRFSRDRIC